MAKVDLESGIAKSLSRACLTIQEVEELEGKGIPTLIVDHGLDSVMAEIVVNHVKCERKRLVFQDQLTRTKLEESIRASFQKVLAGSSENKVFSLEDPTDFSSI